MLRVAPSQAPAPAPRDVEEAVDCKEEEDEEAEQSQDGVRVQGPPATLLGIHVSKVYINLKTTKISPAFLVLQQTHFISLFSWMKKKSRNK